MDEDGDKIELGCLYEATQGGSKLMSLPDGTKMGYLNDGDEIVLSAWCSNTDGVELGFGDCRGIVIPAPV